MYVAVDVTQVVWSEVNVGETTQSGVLCTSKLDTSWYIFTTSCWPMRLQITLTGVVRFETELTDVKLCWLMTQFWSELTDVQGHGYINKRYIIIAFWSRKSRYYDKKRYSFACCTFEKPPCIVFVVHYSYVCETRYHIQYSSHVGFRKHTSRLTRPIRRTNKAHTANEW